MHRIRARRQEVRIRVPRRRDAHSFPVLKTSATSLTCNVRNDTEKWNPVVRARYTSWIIRQKCHPITLVAMATALHSSAEINQLQGRICVNVWTIRKWVYSSVGFSRRQLWSAGLLSCRAGWYKLINVSKERTACIIRVKANKLQADGTSVLLRNFGRLLPDYTA